MPTRVPVKFRLGLRGLLKAQPFAVSRALQHSHAREHLICILRSTCFVDASTRDVSYEFLMSDRTSLLICNYRHMISYNL